MKRVVTFACMCLFVYVAYMYVCCMCVLSVYWWCVVKGVFVLCSAGRRSDEAADVFRGSSGAALLLEQNVID